MALKLTGQSQKAIREGSEVDGVRELEEAERMIHDVTCNANSTDRNRISG